MSWGTYIISWRTKTCRGHMSWGTDIMSWGTLSYLANVESTLCLESGQCFRSLLVKKVVQALNTFDWVVLDSVCTDLSMRHILWGYMVAADLACCIHIVCIAAMSRYLPAGVGMTVDSVLTVTPKSGRRRVMSSSSTGYVTGGWYVCVSGSSSEAQPPLSSAALSSASSADNIICIGGDESAEEGCKSACTSCTFETNLPAFNKRGNQ